MNVTTSAVVTAGIVVLNYIVTDKSVEPKFIIGTLLYLLILSVMNEGAPELAKTLALAVMITVVFLYFPGIAKKMGFTK